MAVYLTCGAKTLGLSSLLVTSRIAATRKYAHAKMLETLVNMWGKPVRYLPARMPDPSSSPYVAIATNTNFQTADAILF